MTQKVLPSNPLVAVSDNGHQLPRMVATCNDVV